MYFLLALIVCIFLISGVAVISGGTTLSSHHPNFTTQSETVWGATANCITLPPITPHPRDPETVAHLQEIALDYVHTYQEEGRLTIVNNKGMRLTRDNLLAVLTLAETGAYQEAGQLLDQVLSTQDLDPGSLTYGYFPVLMTGAPTTDDSTLALFNGTFLAALYYRHLSHFDTALIERVREAVGAAAFVAGQTPPRVGNTNQGLMQAFLPLAAGEILQDDTLLMSGRSIWDAMLDFSYISGFSEGYSPNYAKVDLYVLGFMVDNLKDSCVRRQAFDLRELLWWSITRHYHAPTKQLAGPFVRTKADFMAYELQGIHPALFRESGGQIALPPLPPSHDSSIDPSISDTVLHAILSTMYVPSWPHEWVQQALTVPDGERQIRERTWTFNQQNPASGTAAFSQLTSFLTPKITLGSRNRDPGSLNGETRDIVAYSVHEGAIGIFKTVPTRGPAYETRLVAVQNNRSIAAAVGLDRFKPSSVQTATFSLVWVGTQEMPPSISNYHLGPGEQTTIDWMGTRMRLVFSDYAPAGAPTVTISRPDAASLQLTWEARVPSVSPRSDSYNSVGTLLFGFALSLEDRADRLANLPAIMNPVTLASVGTNLFDLRFVSPDGELRSLFPVTVKATAVDQWVDGVLIPPVPIQDSVLSQDGATRTPMSTRTPTNTRTPTATRTATNTRTPTATRTATNTRTPTNTHTRTPTNTRTPTVTRTATNTRTPTNTRMPTPTNTPIPGLVVEQDYRVLFDSWRGVEAHDAFGGGYRMTTTAGSITYRSSTPATRVSLITYRGPDQGMTQIIIDGVSQEILDLYAPIPTVQYVQEYSGLAMGGHTILVRALGKKNAASIGTEVRVDGFMVDSTSVDDTDIGVSFGSWVGAKNSAANGGSYWRSASQNASVSFTISGTQFAYLTVRGPAFGQAQITVDGEPIGVVDLYHPTVQWQYLLTITGLSEGSHLVQIKVLTSRNANSTGNGIIFDGFSNP